MEKKCFANWLKMENQLENKKSIWKKAAAWHNVRRIKTDPKIQKLILFLFKARVDWSNQARLK